MASSANPTPFHHLLRTLDKRGKLLRVYTQNIDGLEEKAGLNFGLAVPRSRRQKPLFNSSHPIPRCIPLHGSLFYLHCAVCSAPYPLATYSKNLASGTLPDCPECEQQFISRQSGNKRITSRSIGPLRPSVLLYDEYPWNEDDILKISAMDMNLRGVKKLQGKEADLLLVVGTSLNIQGVKNLVKDFSRSINQRSSAVGDRPLNGKTDFTSIYINFEFPCPSEWSEVFDVWIQGDIQKFADLIHSKMEHDIIRNSTIRSKNLLQNRGIRKIGLRIAHYIDGSILYCR
jgi:NAD-dependent SIR2 family protein deacetylase